jgi:hypothetical protein
MTVGRWFWKRTIPGIEVRISQEHWEALMSILRIAGVRDHDISRNIPVWGNVEQFAIGREVGVTFGYSGQLEQFFQRAIPLQLLNVVAAPTELPNEVLPSQPMLRPVA